MLLFEEPSGLSSESALTNAAAWVQALLTGTTATVVATLAIAGLGAMMLSGRLSLNRAMQIIAGCFLLFSASTVARALAGVGDRQIEAGAGSQDQGNRPLPYRPMVPKLEEKDPFGGAAAPPPEQES